MIGNDFGEGTVSPPQLDFEDAAGYRLDYIPGDPNDRFPYVYAKSDETRQWLRRIGEGLGFGWSLTFADGYLWRFIEQDLTRIDPTTGQAIVFPTSPAVGGIQNPRGMAYDGEHFWVNDFSAKAIFEVAIDGMTAHVVSSFPIPDADGGGTNGLAFDGTFLYLRSRDGSQLYRLDRDGNLQGVIPVPGLTGAITWSGTHFWAVGGCDRGICRFDPQGQLVGGIYPVADGTWGLAWDGTHLWTLQRTCELWDDAKMFEVEILTDSL